MVTEEEESIMQPERGVDAVIEFIILLPFAILMIPLFIWDEIRDKRELRRGKKKL